MEDKIEFQRVTLVRSARDYAAEFVRLSSKLTCELYIASLFFVEFKDETLSRRARHSWGHKQHKPNF